MNSIPSDVSEGVEPCPFCRGLETELSSNGENSIWRCCIKCGAEGPPAPTDDEADAAWNTRASPPLPSPGDLTTEQQCQMVADASGWRQRALEAEAIFHPNEEERAAIRELAADQELSAQAVMRQALRLYQLHHMRLKAGETFSFSGDAERAAEFAGPLPSLEVEQYVEDYEYRLNGDAGYRPTEAERDMLIDAIRGYLADREGGR